MRINPLMFAVTLGTLLVAHNVGDHICQTDCQAGHKASEDPGEWVPAMAGHVGSYQLTQAAALAAVLPASGLRPSWRGLLAGTVFSAATAIGRRELAEDLLAAWQFDDETGRERVSAADFAAIANNTASELAAEYAE